YGPVATAAEWGAAELGGTSLARITFWLKLEEAIAFCAVVLALDRLLRADPEMRLRAHLLWSVNPLLLWEIVAGGHIDGLAAVIGPAYLAAGTAAIKVLVTRSTGITWDTMYQLFWRPVLGYTQFSVSSVPPHLELVAYLLFAGVALLALLRFPDRAPGMLAV